MLGRERCYEVVGHGPYGLPDTAVRILAVSYVHALDTARQYIASIELCDGQDVTIVSVLLVTEGTMPSN